MRFVRRQFEFELELGGRDVRRWGAHAHRILWYLPILLCCMLLILVM